MAWVSKVALSSIWLVVKVLSCSRSLVASASVEKESARSLAWQVMPMVLARWLLRRWR